MEWFLDKNRPLCPQISEQLCAGIATGQFEPDERLMSVREVAVKAGVNPNTVQRAFENLEREGILYSIRGSGWYVSKDITYAEQVLYELQKEKTAEYFFQMKKLGLSCEQIKKYVEEWKYE